MSPKRQELTSVSDILGGVRLPKSVKDHVKNHEIWTKWSEIVGADLSRVTSPSELKGKTLEIHVAHQAWAQQLHFLKPSILGKIRFLCPQAAIKDLQFKVGKIEPTLPTDFSSEKDSRAVKTRPLSIKLSERLEMTLRAVEDPDLRASIRSAMEAQELRKD